MPTKLPRINLAVPQDLYDIIKRLAKASHTPITEIVMDLLQGAKPILEVNAAMAETASKMAPAEKLQMSRVMDALEYKYADRQVSTEEVLKEMLAVAQGSPDEGQLDIEEYVAKSASEAVA